LSSEGHKGTASSANRLAQVVWGSGRAQLTLVEHALCPLDTSAALTEGLTHRSEFFYLDESRHQRKATVKVVCPFGLSPGDELYLWGLMALTLSQPEPSVEFYATPHYCLSELGVIPRAGGPGSKGGKNYGLFRQAITRLAAVTYINDHFYDPIAGEHRNVAFGFLSYSLPSNLASSRAWRFVWDPIFFEFCRAAKGSLIFDLEMYRSLDFASRRLFLLLKKIFWRNAQSPAFDVRHLGVHVLGFAPSIDLRDLKIKIARCIGRLAEQGIIEVPAGDSGARGLFAKKGVGAYTVQFRRGTYFEKKAPAPSPDSLTGSPLYGPLGAIGFDDASIARIIRKYKPQLIQVWADITLAAKEKSSGFFKVSPQAYFMDNIERASRGTRTPPDWWYEHRKEEDRRERESKRQLLNLPARPKDPKDEERAFEEFLKGEGQRAFAEILERLMRQYRDAGQTAPEAARSAVEAARNHLRNRFRQEYPELDPSAPTPLGDILKNFRLP
jgi:hypothetical protein